MEELLSNLVFVEDNSNPLDRNARSMELDEKNDNFGMHLSKLGDYSYSQAPSKLIHDTIKAEQTKLAGTRQSRPEVCPFFSQNNLTISHSSHKMS